MGASYHVPHGITSCITLPVVMQAMAAQHAAQLSRIAQVLHLLVSENDATTATQAVTAATAVRDLIAHLGLPQHLQEVGIGSGDLHTIAVNAVGGEGEKAVFAEQLLQQML
jgi:alcohol dehydrogenase class IV